MKTIKLCVALAIVAISTSMSAQSTVKVTLDSYINFSSETAKELGYIAIQTEDSKNANLVINEDGTSSLTLPLDTTRSTVSTTNRGPGDGGICIQIYIATKKSNCQSGIGFRCQTITSCGGNEKKINVINKSRALNAMAYITSNNLILNFDQDLSKFE